MSFKEHKEALEGILKGLITTETPQAQIDKITSAIKEVNELDTAHASVVEDYGKMKDRYIESLTSSGSKTPPDETGAGDDKTPRSFEEIAKDVMSKDKKGN